MTIPNLSGARRSATPFSHVRFPCVLSTKNADAILRLLSKTAAWKVRIEHFYEQEEFSLFTTDIRGELEFLVQPSFVEPIRAAIRGFFELREAPILVDINAHRLTPGQTFRIHNDFIQGGETHRLLIQLNRGWIAENGGLLMLFSSSAPEDVTNVILPKHCSGFAFEISPRSFHAVSQIRSGERYTLVYSFRTRA